MEHTTDNNNNNAISSSASPSTGATDANTGLRRSMFERRNRFTLRLGRRTAIPVILALHDPKSFNEVIFQTILSLMKDKIIKYLQYDPYHGQLRVVSDLPSPQSPVSCSELQGAHHLTLLYYFVPHEPPAFVVRHTGRTLLRTGVQPTPGPSQASERGSAEAEQLDEDEEHVEDDERSWHSLHADEAHDETAEQLDEDEGLARDMDEEDWPAPASESDPDHASSELHHVRGYESLRLLSHVLVLETVSAEHSLTHLLSHQARDSSPPPVHHLSRYFQQPTPTKKRKSGGGDSTRGRKKAKK